MTTPANKVPAGAGQSDEHVEKSLYAKQEKIYPREVHGMFARLRTLGVLGLLGIYYVTPWLRWDGHQAVLFDLPARKFYIFSLVFWPQDFFYLALLLIVAALSLFFFTALAVGSTWVAWDMRGGAEQSELLGIPYMPLRVLVTVAMFIIALIYARRVIAEFAAR